jgi:perosamine synthetase
MSALQAAFGMAQLERIGELVERRRQIFFWYKEMLEGVPGITLNQTPADVRSTYWMVTAVVDRALGIDKEQLIAAMAKRNIGCRPFQYPLSSLPAYEGHADAKAAQVRNHRAYNISPYGINLPSGFNMNQELVSYVTSCFKEILARGPRA